MQATPEDNNSDDQQQKDEPTYKLQLKFKKEQVIELGLTGKDCFFELRNYVSDLPSIYFQPNYHFEHDGRKINEYVEMEKEIPQPEPDQLTKVDIVLDEYDFRSAKELVRKINEFFNNPKKTISQIRLENKSNFIKLDFLALLGKTTSGTKEKRRDLDLSRVLNEGLLSYQSFAKDPWHRFSVIEKNIYIESLEFSGWNPPPSKRKMFGDFFYLRLKTYEKDVFYITAFSRGFFLNKSTDTSFDPSANSDAFFNLLELIASVSPHFKKLNDGNLFESVSVDIQDIPNEPVNEPPRWLKSFDEVDDHKYDPFRAGEEIYDAGKSYNMNRSFRDWNEEIQNYKKMEANDFFDHINKAKIHERIQKDFLEVALEGAKGIVDGKFSAMNFGSQQSDKCYIVNNVFFTFCEEPYLEMRQPRGDDVPCTVATASKDLDNTALLEGLDGKEIFTMQAALIRYRGYTITAQSLIQGILYYDEKTWTKYGSVDEGKSIADDPGFVEVMKKVSKIFHVKNDMVFIDGEGKRHVMPSPIDIKGIQGGDGRKYLLDLFRMCPRDLNWVGEENDAVVFRPKLVESYLNSLRVEVSEGVKQKYSQTLNEMQTRHKEAVEKSLKSKSEIPKPEATASEEEKLKYKQAEEAAQKHISETLAGLKAESQTLHEKICKEIDQEVTKNVSEYTFDTSLFSGLESHYDDKEAEEAEREKLRKLAVFAKEKMVKRFVEHWLSMIKNIPLDTTSLITALHQFGLSERYLGMVVNALDAAVSTRHVLLGTRCILVQCLKRILENILRTIPSIQIPDTLSHVINCVIASESVAEHLEGKVKTLLAQGKSGKKEQGTGSNEEGDGASDAKKKKKKKARKVLQVKSDIEPNQYLTYSPTDLFREVCLIAEKRYQFKFTQKKFTEFVFTRNNCDRASLLREISLSIGLCLGFRDFNLSDQVNVASIEFPIKPSDIGDFVPLIKKQSNEFQYAKIHYNMGAQYVASGKYDAAVDIYGNTLQALLNIYGPCNHSVLEYASTLAAVLSATSKKDQAISIQKSVAKLSEKTYGADNIHTIAAFTELAKYYYESDLLERTLNCLLSALYLADLVGGSFNIESIRLLEEIQSVYSEKKDYKNALTCAEEIQQRFLRIYDKNHPEMAWVYYTLATYYLYNQEYKEATNYAHLRLAIISKQYKTTNPQKVEEAKKFVGQITARSTQGGGDKGVSVSGVQEELETSTLKERMQQNRVLNKRRRG